MIFYFEYAQIFLNYVYKGAIFGRSINDTSSCTKTPPPSNQNNICQQFNDWAEYNDIDLWKGKFDKSYQITHWKEPRHRLQRGRYANVTCYNPAVGNGWCGTCYDFGRNSVSQTQAGFCPTDQQHQKILAEAFRKHDGTKKINFTVQICLGNFN